MIIRWACVWLDVLVEHSGHQIKLIHSWVIDWSHNWRPPFLDLLIRRWNDKQFSKCGAFWIPRESHPLALKYFKLLIFSFVFSSSFSLNYLFGNILHAIFHWTCCACLKQFGKKCQLLRIAGGTFSFVKGLWDSVSPHRPFLSTILDFPIRHMNVRLSWPYSSSWQFSNPRADTFSNQSKPLQHNSLQ